MLRTYFDEKNKIWSGRKVHPIFHPKLSLGHAILWRLQQNPDRIAQVSADSSIQLTKRDLYIKTVRAAQNLKKLGFQRNDVFGLVAKNSHHVAPIVFASWCLGCPINTLDTAFNRTEMKHMLGITKPKLLFCDASVCDLVSDCLDELQNNAKIYTFGGACTKSEAVEELFVETHNESEFVAAEVDGENDVAVILCSSGTSGLSKGVSLSHAVLVRLMAADFSADNVIFSFSSLYWLSGLIMLLVGTLFGAKRIITTESYSPELFLSILENFKVTYASASVYQIVLATKCKNIISTDLSSVRIFFCGGSKAPPEICEEFNRYLPNGTVAVVYGLSEIGGSISVTVIPDNRCSEGKLSNGIQVKIIDENGNKCGIGVDGEICVKSEYKVLGYYRNEKATAQVIDNDGFLLTGDIGHFDESGYLYFVDRKKDLLKYCSSQISPVEIENYLTEVSGIKAACVVGIYDAGCGDLPAAVVVRNENRNITKEEIEQLVCDHFADYKRLRGGVFFVESFPTTPSGKIIRRKVKEIAEQFYKQKLQAS